MQLGIIAHGAISRFHEETGDGDKWGCTRYVKGVSEVPELKIRESYIALYIAYIPILQIPDLEKAIKRKREEDPGWGGEWENGHMELWKS
jgi:hypothetical protein